MREEQVANGVNFLVHPKVKTAPLSQRISFLENKGLTPEEIQAALSRVEAGEADLPAAGARGDTGTATATAVSPRASPFPAEAPVSLWRQVAVPGALVAGAVGALGTYYAASRSSEAGGRNHRGSSDSRHAAAAAGRIPYSSGGAGAGEARGTVALTGEDDAAAYAGGTYAEGPYAQEISRLTHSQRLEDGAAAFPAFDNGNAGGDGGGGGGFRVGVADGAGSAAGEAPSLLAGELRRLTETMERQAAHLVEAVEAMKALASRAEEDSNSLLAARVTSHTSELRAELGTIKQLLLLQAGVEGGGAPPPAAAAAAAAASGQNGGATGSVGVAKAKGETGPNIALGGAEGVEGATELRGNGLGAENALSAKDPEEEKAREAADKLAAEEAALAATARRKDAARAALGALLADNAPQAAKDGMAMLRMLVSNLVNQPNVPRYRRIATSNDNFKKRLLPLEGHRAMMESVGFKAKGSLWEWTWHEDSGPSASSNNRAVLEDVVKAIDAVARPNGPPMPSATASTVPVAAALPPAASARTTPTPPAMATPAGTKQPAGVTAVISDNGTAVSETDGVARQGPRFSGAAWVDAAGRGGGGGGAVEDSFGDAAGARAGDAARTGSAPTSEGATATATNDVLAAAAEVNRAAGDNACGDAARSSGGARATAIDSEIEASAGESAAATAATVGSHDPATVEPGSPPASMAEVAAALQRGDEPPGIKVVEDRLSADAQSLATPSQPSPPKPWEVFAGAAAKGATAPEKNPGVGERAGGGVTNGRGYGSGEDGTRPQHAVSVGP